MPVLAKQPNWFVKLQKIKIFQSSKRDVEKVFDLHKVTYSSNEDSREKGWGEIMEYQTNDGKLEAYYSTGKCSDNNNKTGWNIDEGVVVSVKFEPDTLVKLSELNLDLSTFTREKESDTQYYNYKSSELGIEFTTLGEKVTSFEYSLTPEMEALDCEKVLEKKL